MHSDPSSTLSVSSSKVANNEIGSAIRESTLILLNPVSGGEALAEAVPEGVEVAHLVEDDVHEVPEDVG